MTATLFGTWVERLEALAVGREVVAVAGRRDAAGPPAARVHVFSTALLDGKGAAWSLDVGGAGAAVWALAFAGDGLLLGGGDDGRVIAWDVAGKRQVAELALGAPVRAIAIDAGCARGAAGMLAVGTADGALHHVRLAISNATPALAPVARRALSDGAITAVAWDPAELWVAGGADGRLWVIGDGERALAPGGDGGVRAIACLGDGRAALGLGDGSVRLCFLVGDVEASDRSGDHGHAAAVRGLALGPVIVDDAGREQPRRLFSVGEDGALKAWFVDGARRPKTIELGAGPASALAFAPGPVARLDRAAGRLWIATTARNVATLALGGDVEPVGEPVVIGSTFDSLEAQLRDARAATKVKLAAVAALAGLAEDEARSLLDGALASGPLEVQIAATRAMAQSDRRTSRPALRTALTGEQAELRGAAFDALVALEADQPLAAVRAGLATRFEDVRLRAIEAALGPARSSVIARGVLAEALRDPQVAVRRRAFAALREVDTVPGEAIRTALLRGTPDLRAEALLTLGFMAGDGGSAARALAAGAFDDADPGVRSAAFLAAVVLRPRLAARLVAVAPGVAAALDQVARDLGVVLALPPDAAVPLDDDELEPVFAQLACRSADAAIRGAGCLLALGDPRAVGAVLQLTREADPVLRRGATANLVTALAMWPDDDRLATRLAWLLDDPDAEVRAFAFDALARAAGAQVAAPSAGAQPDVARLSEIERRLAARRGANKLQPDPAPPPPPVAVLTAPQPSWSAPGGLDAELELAELALRTSHEDIRGRALQILVRVGAPGSAVAARADRLLGDALEDEAAKVRGEAFRTLWTWHSAEPLVPLTRATRSRHADLRARAVDEIARRRRADQSSSELDRLVLGLVADPVAAVGLAAYAVLTRSPDQGSPVPVAAEVHLAAMASPAVAVRTAGAKGAATAPAAVVRGRLVQLVKDEHPEVHIAAIEALDAVAPHDAEGFALALGSVFYALAVRAGELCGVRRDARAVAPMQRLLSIGKTELNRPGDAIRQRAARALADVGEPSTIAYQRGLVEDDDVIVREMAARGIATAAHAGSSTALATLVGLLGHADLPVRSWAAEGLAKLGDLRALPVLAGTQRHDHRPLRVGAIVGFVALGADGVRGLRQGLEDSEREIRDLAFAVIVARDLALAAAGIAPDLLIDALSSPSAEIRFAAARLVERRAADEPLDAEVIGELIGPRKPDKAGDLKDWPPEPRRAAMLQVLADAIASDEPGRRYAAAQVLAVRAQPLTFWREAARLAGPGRFAPVPHTGWSSEARLSARPGWLRRLVGERRAPEAGELETLARLFVRAGKPADAGTASAQRLVFGVYAGLIRQAPTRGAADETHRVRRDAIARLVVLAREDAIGLDAVLPVLGHAVGDPHQLVRHAAMAALRSLYPAGALAPLELAIAGAADLGKAAIDELVGLALAGDDRARGLIGGALDAASAAVRAHAARRLLRLYPSGSVEPQLLAAQSRHADVRLAAVTELAEAFERPAAPGASDATAAVTEALVAALASEHADLRLRAAVALARRGDPVGIDVLGGFLRSEDHADEALEALIGLADGRAHGARAGAGAAAAVVAAWLADPERRARADDPDEPDEPYDLIGALGELGHPAGAPALVRMLVDVPAGKQGELESIIDDVFDAVLEIVRDRSARPRRLPDGGSRQRLRDELALVHLGELARSPLVEVRTKTASALGDVDAHGAEDVLARLLGDREPDVRVAAADALALRAEYVPGATLTALEAALRGGRRELVLPAALGLAARKRPEAFQPLLLVAKAGEPEERERALVALGALGDRRALEHLLPLLEPALDDEASRALTPAAAEALGRLLSALTGDEADDVRARIVRLAAVGTGEVRLRALTGLRCAGELAPLEAVAADREALDSVRVHAIEQLGLAGAPASEAVLADLLSDEDYDVREAAVPALLAVLGGDRTRVSLHGLGSPFEQISRPAATYLATAGDPAAMVARLGSIRSAEVRQLLREGLARRDALPRAELEAALASSSSVARAEAAWLVGNAGPAALPMADGVVAAVERSAAALAPRSYAALGATELAAVDAAWASLWAARRVGAAAAVAATAQGVLGDDRAPATLRREAASVLAAAATPAALGALRAATGDPDRVIRTVSATALAARQPDVAAASVRALGGRADAASIAPLALAAWPSIARELIAEPATRTWSLAVGLGGRRVDELIAIAQAKGDPATRRAAIAALGRLGGEAARSALVAIHDDATEDDAIKLAAWKALRRLARHNARSYAAGQDKGPSGGATSDADNADEDADDEDGDDEDGDDEDDDDEDDDDADGDDEDGDDEDDDDEDDDDEDDGDEDDGDEDDDDEDDDDEDDDDEDDDD